MPVILVTQEDCGSKPARENSSRDYISKISNTHTHTHTHTHTQAGGVAQIIACLPSKPEALSSNPSTEKKIFLIKKRMNEKAATNCLPPPRHDK
jgi:hypothetical protein